MSFNIKKRNKVNRFSFSRVGVGKVGGACKNLIERKKERQREREIERKKVKPVARRHHEPPYEVSGSLALLL